MKILLNEQEVLKILSTLNIEEIRDKLGFNWIIWKGQKSYINDVDEVFELESKDGFKVRGLKDE